MKTSTSKTGLCFAIICAFLVLSSFTPKHEAFSFSNKGINWEEYEKVRSFAWENVCKPIRQGLISNRGKGFVNQFSRCPSGYQTAITSPEDSVKTDKFVKGEIVLYRGCEPSYVCDFKVNVSMGLVVVKNKNSKEYMSVNDWINSTNNKRSTAAGKTVVKS